MKTQTIRNKEHKVTMSKAKFSNKKFIDNKVAALVAFLKVVR